MEGKKQRKQQKHDHGWVHAAYMAKYFLDCGTYLFLPMSQLIHIHPKMEKETKFAKKNMYHISEQCMNNLLWINVFWNCD